VVDRSAHPNLAGVAEQRSSDVVVRAAGTVEIGLGEQRAGRVEARNAPVLGTVASHRRADRPQDARGVEQGLAVLVFAGIGAEWVLVHSSSPLMRSNSAAKKAVSSVGPMRTEPDAAKRPSELSAIDSASLHTPMSRLLRQASLPSSSSSTSVKLW
jgi:hypothetical protein